MECSFQRQGELQPKTAERRCLFQAEVLQEIAESAGKANNGKLKTVDKAAAKDGVEEASLNSMS